MSKGYHASSTYQVQILNCSELVGWIKIPTLKANYKYPRVLAAPLKAELIFQQNMFCDEPIICQKAAGYWFKPYNYPRFTEKSIYLYGFIFLQQLSPLRVFFFK